MLDRLKGEKGRADLYKGKSKVRLMERGEKIARIPGGGRERMEKVGGNIWVYSVGDNEWRRKGQKHNKDGAMWWVRKLKRKMRQSMHGRRGKSYVSLSQGRYNSRHYLKTAWTGKIRERESEGEDRGRSHTKE